MSKNQSKSKNMGNDWSLNKRQYKQCANCVMDTSDSKIIFDANGICDHCIDFKNNVMPNWRTDGIGREDLQKQVEKIKADGKGRSFDCIMGMSGGLDSSYLLHLAVKSLALDPWCFMWTAGGIRISQSAIFK
jgi:hypothetical protein